MSKLPYNIIIINPDQMRADYMTPAGHPFIETRNLNRLAEKGTYFPNAFTISPMCGPSRTSFITGQYPIEHQVRNYVGTMSPDYPNMLSELKRNGYNLGLFGKDHIIEPDAIGVMYDEGEDICIGNMDDHPGYKKSWDSGSLAAESKYNLTERLTTNCLNFIERNVTENKPYFATINLQDPHPYFAAPAPYDSLFSAEQFELPKSFRTPVDSKEPVRLTNWRIHSESLQATEQEMKEAMAMYCGQIRYVDDQVGRIIDKLEQLDQLDNTVIIFWSDHGEFLGDFGVTHKGLMFYDCLTRIPLIMYDPSGHLSAGSNSHLIESIDIMPTVLSILGIDTPSYCRGQSLLSEDYIERKSVLAEGGIYAVQPKEPISGLVIKAPHDPTQWGPGTMLRTKKHKLVIYADDNGELYDLTADPEEISNLFDDERYKEVRHKLTLTLLKRQQCQGQPPEFLPKTVQKVFERNPKSYLGDFEQHENLLRIKKMKNNL
ncbi:sulfatase [Vibrio sp. F74]|uniref:sulfatase family protein n=1 Tax=Vibrio sp. F74 TaxID=700020 RepID=UPI0035F5D40B